MLLILFYIHMLECGRLLEVQALSSGSWLPDHKPPSLEWHTFKMITSPSYRSSSKNAASKKYASFFWKGASEAFTCTFLPLCTAFRH